MAILKQTLSDEGLIEVEVPYGRVGQTFTESIQEMINWLDPNPDLNGYFKYFCSASWGYRVRFYFTDEKTALVFKLRWG